MDNGIQPPRPGGGKYHRDVGVAPRGAGNVPQSIMETLMPTKRELFLHVGLPKTASSALQVWADSNRQFLRENGIHYPEGDSGAAMPKHQDLVGALFRGDFTCLDRYLAANAELALFLSTEGLTNHLYDYPSRHLATFRKKISGFRVTALLMVRSTEDWITSYWKQALLNPYNDRFNYATPLARDAFAQLPRIRRLCNLKQVTTDIRESYGADDVIVADQGENWFERVIEVLRLPPNVTPPSRVHVSVSKELAEIVRQMNSLVLPTSIRDAFLALVQYSCQTQHNILLSHYATHSPAALTAKSDLLKAALSKLVPATTGEQEIVDRMVRQLEDFCHKQGTSGARQ